LFTECPLIQDAIESLTFHHWYKPHRPIHHTLHLKSGVVAWIQVKSIHRQTGTEPALKLAFTNVTN